MTDADEASSPPGGQRPLVSVVIPCWNHAHFLGAAIESALGQTWRPVEIIVVDDGSTDDTQPVIARFPSVIGIGQPNSGLAAARNTGLRASRGRYVTFLDADDQLLPIALQVGVEILDERLDWAFVSGAFRYIDEKGSAISSPIVAPFTNDHFAALLRDCYVAMGATVLYRRSMLERLGGFDASLAACEDWDLYLRIARQCAIGQHRQLVACYRRHDGNMSRDAGLMLVRALRVLGRQRPYIRRDPHLRSAYRAGVRFCCAYYDAAEFGWTALARICTVGRRREGLQGLWFVLRRMPRQLFKILYLAFLRAVGGALCYLPRPRSSVS